MLNFRQKIFLSYVLVFLMFLALMSPVASFIVRRIVEQAMENRALELISKIQNATDDASLIRRLKELKPVIFFRVGVITDEGKVLYDSHTKKILGARFSQEHVVNHPEVMEAFAKGSGYNEDYSEILAQKFAYTAVAFDFHGKTYVMRTAFPYRYVKELTNDFEVGFLILASIVLVFFSIMTWFIINHLTKPIQSIISIAMMYKEGERIPLPELQALSSKIGTSEDVGKLATTLVSLSQRLSKQISNLRDERNEKEVLLESLIEGVIATDPDMHLTFINQAAIKLLGLPNAEALNNQPFQHLGHPKAYELLLACQREDRPIVDNMRVEAGDVIYYIDVVAVPKRDNTGAILVLIDKSDHYKLLEMRKDFIANASHELKTPITIIRGFAETLYDNPDLPINITKEITGKIVRNCERMATLVRDLLALADIENIPRSRIRPFDIVALIEKVKLTVNEVFQEADIKILSSDKEIIIEADQDLIEMAMMNLIQNAVKYSTAPADVTVKIDVAADEVVVQIKDKGIGIPKQDLQRIFDRFYRVNKALSQKVGGSGLGLSIVNTVIRKHFGKIFVESEMGVGSTFTVILPLKHILGIEV